METTQNYCFKKHRMRKIILGFLVIIAGALLIGFNMGFLPVQYKDIVFSWQMLLIAIGLINLFGRDHWALGIILIAVGAFFLAPELYFFPFDFTGLMWPALLIILGLVIIFNRGRSRHRMHRWQRWHHESGDYKIESGYIEESNVFSGNKHIFPPGEFKGGKISNIFGGTEIDLTQTTLAEGTNILEIDCVFGGINLIVPSDWNVKIAVKSVMGGFSDKRRIVKTNGSKGELIIRGSTVFGGGEIKSA